MILFWMEEQFQPRHTQLFWCGGSLLSVLAVHCLQKPASEGDVKFLLHPLVRKRMIG